MTSLAKIQATVAAAAHYMALLCVYQIVWLNNHATVKVWEKSRRIGASWVEALYTVLQASRKRSEGGQSSYYLSYNKDMTRQFISDCAWWAKVLQVVCGEMEEVIIIDDEGKDITIFRIDFASGNEICALPSEARSLRSKQGRVIIDEAAFVDDLEELLKAAMALLMWGGQVVILSTHNGADNPFNDLIRDIHAGKKPYTHFYTDFDQALEGGFFKAICRKKNEQWSQEKQDAWRAKTIDEYGDGADEELFCIPSRSGGVYLTTDMIEACMHDSIPVFRWAPPADDFVDWPEEKAAMYILAYCENHLKPLLETLPEDCAHYFGEDFGRSGDLTVIAPGTETAKLDLHLPFILELRNCPHRSQEQFLFYIVDKLPSFSGGALDASGNGSFLAESARQRYGAGLIAEVKMSEDWYRVTMPRLKSRIEDRSVLLPLDAHILADLRSLKVVRGVARVPDKRGKDAKGQRHGDAAIALGMLIHARELFEQIEDWECETVSAPHQIAVMDMSGY